MSLRKLSLIAALAVCLQAGVTSAEEIRLAHAGSPGSTIARSAEEFAARANHRLGDRAEVIVFGQGSLGTDRELLIKLKLGTIDLALPGAVLSTDIPEFGLFDLPYLVTDRQHMARIREQVVKPLLVPLAAQRGYRIIGVWENGFRHITNNVRPIFRPEDLQGIRLRIPEGAWRVRMFEALGVNATPLPYSELFVALQTGVVDGQENPLANIYSAHLYEVQRYLSLTGHLYAPVYLTAGARWMRLKSDVQAILQELAGEMEDFSMRVGEEADDALLTKLGDVGMRINRVERNAFAARSTRVYELFAADVPDGVGLISLARSLVSNPASKEAAEPAR